jgi:hypothetical protein
MAGRRRGPVPQSAKREQYAALIGLGVTYSEALPWRSWSTSLRARS